MPFTRTIPRLLYLGFAFPPGVQALFPGVNPAGHPLETQMVHALRTHFEIRSVGVMPKALDKLPENADPKSGIAHQLLLVDQPPEAVVRPRSLKRLKQTFLLWEKEGWVPEAILVYNLTPIYNAFIRWLTRRGHSAKKVVLLSDSSQLGKPLSRWKRFRYFFKPLIYADETMLPQFQACIGWSMGAEEHARRFALPFLWVPGGCDPSRAVREMNHLEGPVRFAYFGSLADHAGVSPLLQSFLKTEGKTSLHLCGYGKQSGEVMEFCQEHSSRLRFHGLLTADECLQFAQSYDVLVNPRPLGHGNENNFPSKVFEYALAGRSILTTGFAGVREVLGEAAFYLDENALEESIVAQCSSIAMLNRLELDSRGKQLQQRITSHYSWEQQANRIHQFCSEL
jgi:glycosyltransferase involved in cell wall biosynthesis